MEELRILMDLQQRAKQKAAASVLPGQELPLVARMVLPVWWADVDTLLDQLDVCWSPDQRNLTSQPGRVDLARWRAAIEDLVGYNGPRRDQVNTILIGGHDLLTIQVQCSKI